MSDARTLRRLLATVAVAVLCFVAWQKGMDRRGTFVDHGAEDLFAKETFDIAAGNHRYGIVWYTHFPSGPHYIFATLLRLGLATENKDGWRVMTIWWSVIALGVFAWVLLNLARSTLEWIWFVFFLSAFTLQPAFYAWQGSLYEYSLHMSLMLVLAAGAISFPRFYPLFGFVIGYIGGWLGYDWLPPETMLLFFVRFHIHFMRTPDKVRRAVFNAAYDTLSYVAGATAAIMSHLMQNALFFGSFRQAVQDLLGSASVRMGLEQAEVFKAIYPDQWAFAGSFNPFIVTKAMVTSFLWGSQSPWQTGVVFGGPNKWSNMPLFLAFFWFGIVYALVLFVRSRGGVGVLKGGALYLMFLFGVCCCSFTWYFLMPYHASCHLLYLPRHLLAGMLFMGMAPVLARRAEPNWRLGVAGPKTKILLFLALFPAILVLSFVYYKWVVS